MYYIFAIVIFFDLYPIYFYVLYILKKFSSISEHMVPSTLLETVMTEQG